jgi:hypothetical protein
MDPCIAVWLNRNTNKMLLCNRIYYSKVYWRLNMFRAAHRLSSGALNRICSLWFTYLCGDRPLPKLSGEIDHQIPIQPWQRPVTIWVYKPEAANTVYSCLWWAVCRSKHVEPSINFGIINSITKLHLVGISTEPSYEFSGKIWENQNSHSKLKPSPERESNPTYTIYETGVLTRPTRRSLNYQYYSSKRHIIQR